MHCMELYTNERVMQQTFSNEKTIDNLLKEMEDLYTLRFGGCNPWLSVQANDQSTVIQNALGTACVDSRETNL